MSGFKRFLYVAYFIVSFIAIGVIALVALGKGPLAVVFSALVGETSFYVSELVLLGIVAIGLVVILVKAIVTPGIQPTQRSDTPLGTISVTQRMLEDTCESVIDKHNELDFDSVHAYITNGEKPSCDVDLVVMPIDVENLSVLGPKLQAEIKNALEKLTGNSVGNVSITFREQTRRSARKREPRETIKSTGDSSAAEDAAETNI